MSSTASGVIPPPLGSGGLGAAVAPINDEQTLSNNPGKWYFDKAGMENTPSRRCGMDAEKELSYRQSAACFIQDMGIKLKVNQLCNNTAIVYMNRFYMFHSFTHFHRNAVSIATIFLAAKVEEQPRKLDHVVRVAHYIQNRNEPMIDPKSEIYQTLSTELVMNENILLQTLGFDLAVDHPHTHIIKCCQLVRASKDLGQVSYLLATNILHLTAMCVQYRPTLVATLAIQIACKWSGWQIPRSKEGKDWWKYVDEECTYPELEELTQEYLDIYDKAPPRLKLKPGTHGTGSFPSKSSQVPNQTSGPPVIQPSSNKTNLNVQVNPNQRSRSRSPSPKRQRVTKPGEIYGAGGVHPTSKQLPPGKHPNHGTSGHPGAPHPTQKHHHGPPPHSTSKPPHPQQGHQNSSSQPMPNVKPSIPSSNDRHSQPNPGNPTYQAQQQQHTPHGPKDNLQQQRKPPPPYYSSSSSGGVKPGPGHPNMKPHHQTHSQQQPPVQQHNPPVYHHGEKPQQQQQTPVDHNSIGGQEIKKRPEVHPQVHRGMPPGYKSSSSSGYSMPNLGIGTKPIPPKEPHNKSRDMRDASLRDSRSSSSSSSALTNGPTHHPSPSLPAAPSNQPVHASHSQSQQQHSSHLNSTPNLLDPQMRNYRPSSSGGSMMSNNSKPTPNKDPMTQQKPPPPLPISSNTFPSTIPNLLKITSRPPLPPGPPPNNNNPPPPQQTQMNPFSSLTPLIKTEIENVKQELGIETTASHSAGPMAKGSPQNAYSLSDGVQIKQEKHKKKKKEKHKDKDKERHKEKKHKNKDKKKDKKKDKERGDKKHQQQLDSSDDQLTPPLSQPQNVDGLQQRENLKIKLTLKKPDIHHSSSSSSNNSKKNSNLRS